MGESIKEYKENASTQKAPQVKQLKTPKVHFLYITVCLLRKYTGGTQSGARTTPQRQREQKKKLQASKNTEKPIH